MTFQDIHQQNWEGQANHAAVRTILHVAANATVHLIQVLADNSADSWNDVGCVAAEKGSIELTRLYLTKGNLTSGVRADLIGDGSSFTSHSGYLVQQNRTLDMNVIVNHIGKKTMSEIIASIYRKMKKTGQKEGILFIDEINCVSETLAPTMLQFLQCKTFGNQAIPEGWLIVAAGNPPEYNKSVRDFDMVTLDRVRYLNIEADYKVWKEYARAKHLHNAILSYLELRQKNFYRVEADVDGIRFVTARGWEDLSSLMQVYEKLDLPVDESVIREFIHHEDVAEDAAAYFELYRKYRDDYGIADILAGKVRPETFARINYW